MEIAAKIWVGNYGDYKIPQRLLAKTRFTKSGYPDKRSKRAYLEFMTWVFHEELSQAAELANKN